MVFPVWPICQLMGTHPSSAGGREEPTAPPRRSARACSSLKPSPPPPPPPPPMTARGPPTAPRGPDPQIRLGPGHDRFDRDQRRIRLPRGERRVYRAEDARGAVAA